MLSYLQRTTPHITVRCHPMYTPLFIKRFWEKVDKTSNPRGCWLWTASLDKDGYGQIRTSRPHRKWLKAHRVAWEITVGPIPDALHVLHKLPCTNRHCILHLYTGTNTQNIQDMLRAPSSVNHILYKKGAEHPLAKLDNAAILSIRSLYAAGNTTQKQLAVQYKVTRQHISTILTNGAWSHLPLDSDAIQRAKQMVRSRGERIAISKLQPEDVTAIRTAWECGTSQKALARQYGVTDIAIHCIVHRKTWRHLP